MSLRVGMDARCLNTNFLRGMGEYVSSVVTHIDETQDVDWIFYGNRPDLPFHQPACAGTPKVRLRDVRGNRLHIWEQVALPLAASFDRVQVLHCTATTLPLWQPVPTVVTLHDTIPWNTGEFLPAGFYRDRLLPRAFAKCAKIITISDHSRNDILRYWPNLADKVRVIHHGVNDEFLHCSPAPPGQALQDLGITPPYLLYLGGTTQRKRLVWTLELFHALGRAGVSLVVCGVPELSHDRYRRNLRPELRDRVVFAPFIAAEDMPALYQNALAVLYPTLYEGFGFPALNAQAVGTPVILNNVSSLRELVGPGAIALDPDDTNGWMEACNSVVDRRLIASVPDAASRDWARHFDWRNSAAAHWEVYREVAGGRAAG
jgi:glycosyltransferase involved in cell wall biosynthesis